MQISLSQTARFNEDARVHRVVDILTIVIIACGEYLRKSKQLLMATNRR
jgi:hypothetical protein